VDREVAFEDEVAAILDLGDGIEAGQIDRFALLVAFSRSSNNIRCLSGKFGLPRRSENALE
jgi:hypothetical protein